MDMITINTRTEMSGTGHRYIGDSITAALHIDNVRLEDDGLWGCRLEDDQGKILSGRTVKLVVLGKSYYPYSRNIIDSTVICTCWIIISCDKGEQLAIDYFVL